MLVLEVMLPKMCSKGNNEVVDAIAGIVCSENHGPVLPVVFLGAAVGAVLAHLWGEGGR